jgi:hypothetical protein
MIYLWVVLIVLCNIERSNAVNADYKVQWYTLIHLPYTPYTVYTLSLYISYISYINGIPLIHLIRYTPYHPISLISHVSTVYRRGRTLFLDPNRGGAAKATEGLLFKMPDVEASDENSLPLIPDESPTFPGSRQFLFLNEMKWRELIFDCVQRFDGRMVRVFVDDSTGTSTYHQYPTYYTVTINTTKNTTGLIHPEGVECRILERKSLKSGEIMCVIEATKRLVVESTYRKPTASYLTAVVSSSLEYEEMDQEKLARSVKQNQDTCINVYCALKAYLRLVALRFKNIYTEDDEEYGNERYLCISPAIYKYRPSITTEGTQVEESLEEQQTRHRYVY